MSNFIYPPIDNSKSEVRVLDIQPGVPGERVVCTLVTVTLQMAGDYEALSYTWGDETLRQDIILNGCEVTVTQNAEVALQHLRKSNEFRRIWIDAICINQLDNDDKLHQVQLMGEIYKHAATVLVWLGEASEGSDTAIDLVEVLHQRLNVARDRGSLIPTQEFCDLPVGPLRALFSILKRPYWTRTWIIQEVAFGKSDPVVGCGNRWLSWNQWFGAMFQIHAYSHLLRQAPSLLERRTGLGPDHIELLEEQPLVYNFEGLLNIRTAVVAGVDQNLKSIRESRPKSQWENTNILYILDRARGHYASNSRDSIFALLGLMKHLDEDTPLLNAMVPDYSKTVRRVYCETVKFALDNEQTLEILQFRNHLRNPEFPSWTPDFSAKNSCRYPSLAQGTWHTWSASGKLKRHLPNTGRWRVPELSDDLKILHVNTKTVDVIDRVLDLEMMVTDPLGTFDRIRCFVFPRRFRIIPQRFRRTERTPLSFHVHDALWRTLIGNRSEGNELPCPDRYMDAYMKLIKYRSYGHHDVDLVPTPELNTFLAASYAAVTHYSDTPHRRLFITTTGRLGLGPPDCEAGDLVSIIKFYSMPAILRRPSPNYYIFIGSAYVHGIMEGEAIPAQELGDEFEWIAIH